jgi:FAD/FMN-containing dehydrogenase
VVTEFQFKLHPLGPDVQLVMPVYPAEKGKVALQVLHELMSAAPDELGIIGFYGYIPDDEEMPEPIRNREVFVFFGCYSGPESAFTSVVRPLQQLGPPLAELGGRMPYTDVQQTLDEEYPDGRRYYWRSLYLDDLTSQMIDTIHAYGTKRPSKLSTLDVWAMGGAVDRLAPDETAFRQRGAKYMLAVEANWTDPMDDAANIAWARDVVAAMKPYTNRGSYLNFGGSRAESTTALEEAYGSNLKRLREIKQRYDPAHLFG